MAVTQAPGQAGPRPDAGPSARARAGLARRSWDALFRRREASVLLVVIGLAIYFSAVNPNFASPDNARVIAQFTARVAIISAGMVMLLICGEIDLSVGHVYAMAPFLMFFATEWGLPLPLAIVVALAGAAAIGFTNGMITTKFGVPSFITTLGMLFLLNGITLTISNGFPRPAPRGVLPSILGGEPYTALLWALAIVAVGHVVLNQTRWGVYTFAVGGNPVAASESGVRTDRIKIGNFMLTSCLGGFAGILDAIRITSIDPLAGGSSVMFLAVSAAVIGGTALAGGSGTIVGALLGALVLSVLRDGFTLQGISAFTFDMILGAAILVSMILNQRLARLRKGVVPA